jgi:dTDP-4-dehydrorhamnose reductase
VKTILLGANGQLGRSFVGSEGLRRLGQLVFATRDGSAPGGIPSEIADLGEPRALIALLDRVKPNVIINAAAYTAVDRAEVEEPLATAINGQAPGILGSWAAVNNALVLHYSTDYIFDGKGDMPYAVDDQPAPLSAYGRSKLSGEQALRSSGAQHLIFRTAWVYSAQGNNFLRTMLRLGAERPELRVVGDQFGTPTTTDLIVEASLTALALWQKTPSEQKHSLLGTYHLVADGVTTWHGFATSIVQKAVAKGLIQAPGPRIIAIGTEDYPTPATRPAWSVLDNSSFSQRYGFTFPDWHLGLDQVINSLYLEANGKSC